MDSARGRVFHSDIPVWNIHADLILQGFLNWWASFGVERSNSERRLILKKTTNKKKMTAERNLFFLFYFFRIFKKLPEGWHGCCWIGSFYESRTAFSHWKAAAERLWIYINKPIAAKMSNTNSLVGSDAGQQRAFRREEVTSSCYENSIQLCTPCLITLIFSFPLLQFFFFLETLHNCYSI